MTPLALPISEVAELKASAALDADRLVLTLIGTADLRVSQQLDLLLGEVHREALARGCGQVDVDLRELEFMNSSCFKSFVAWIARLGELPQAEQYRIRLLSDPTLIWQRRSLHSLSCFAPELISVIQGAA